MQLDLAVTAGGICNAVAFWFELHLDEETHISTSPYSEKVRFNLYPCAYCSDDNCTLSTIKVGHLEKQIHLSV